MRFALTLVILLVELFSSRDLLSEESFRRIEVRGGGATDFVLERSVFLGKRVRFGTVDIVAVARGGESMVANAKNARNRAFAR